MSINKITLPLSFKDGNAIELVLIGEELVERTDAFDYGEATIQLKEGFVYEYQLTRGYSLRCSNESNIVIESKINSSTGRISPNIYVGTLVLEILNQDSDIKCSEIKLEVQSSKVSYRDDYRFMLEEIAEKCMELIFQPGSPVSQYFEVNHSDNPKTLYQRFAFIKSVLDSKDFDNAIHNVISAPVTRWKEDEVIKDIRSMKRLSSASIKQLASGKNRVHLSHNHPLRCTISSVPNKIKVNNKTETTDTPENRFVKYAVTSFFNFCKLCNEKFSGNLKAKREAERLVFKLELITKQDFFKDILLPVSFSFNSPVLQRKGGYKDILRSWLMFNLAAKLNWLGGQQDVYSGNKRNVAALYEFWLFFKLLDIIKEVFNINSLNVNDLFKETKDGISLQLKQGNVLHVDGTYNTGFQKLKIQFCYNKTFSGGSEYPAGGSWSRNLRPDYTLSFWSDEFKTEEEAELLERIVHIHFDAKYKVERLTVFGDEIDINSEVDEQKGGTYKSADLLKMHTYKDAIRRSVGAYVLYPGNDKSFIRQEYLGMVPGVGAFAIRPSKVDDGSVHLKDFLSNDVKEFIIKSTQKEKIVMKTHHL